MGSSHRAPGKIVLSGAYSVLWGATAIVAAVDRFAVAHAEEPPVHVADEVRAALELGILDRACGVDVSALRAPADGGGTRKLGLGSSAAIVVATLAALGVADVTAPGGRERIFEAALRAHKHVQPGGSGVDVAASTFGGVLACRVHDDGSLAFQTQRFPAPVAIFASRTPASTKELVARVRAFEQSRPDDHARIIADARSAAERAASATSEEDLLAALRAQDRALRELAKEACVPIFTPDLDVLARAAEEDGAFFGPSGAGGGDIGIRVGSAPTSAAFATALARVGVDPLEASIGAPGVEPCDA